MNPTVSKEELASLYYEHRSVHKVGKIVGKCGETVRRWIMFYNIPKKPKICSGCNTLLTEDLCYKSDWATGGAFCKECRKKQNRNTTKEKMQEYGKINDLTLRQLVLDNYGDFCECCGENIWQFLTIDHIEGWGAKERKELNKNGKNRGGGGSIYYQFLKNNNFPKEGLRILCMNCNASNGFHGFCQHQITKSHSCYYCNIELDNSNRFEFYTANNISVCKNCVMSNSIKRGNIKELVNKRGNTIEQRRMWAKGGHLKRKQKIIEGYGAECVCCGNNDYLFLSIDHINNDGNKDKLLFDNQPLKFFRYLIDNNFPKDRYQLMCYNCNCCKGTFGECYHSLIKRLNKDTVSIDDYKRLIKLGTNH